MKPTVFISYTGRDDTGPAVSGALFGLLEANGFTALLDRERLQHGDQWHDGLNDMLIECHAAVVVLSPEVKDSDWVRREALILGARRRVCRDFVLLPILVGGVQEADFAGLGFDDLKPFQHCEVNAIDDLVADGSALRRLSEGFQVLAPESAVQIKIAAYLRKAEWESLLALARELKVEPEQWAGERTLSAMLARHIAAALPDLPLVRVALAMEHVLPDIQKPRCKEILGLLASNWVPPTAARRLRGSHWSGGGCYALNSADSWTCGMYFRRARAGSSPWKSIHALGVHGGEDELDSLVDELRREWPSAVGGSWDRRERIIQERRRPVFAVISAPATDGDLRTLLDHKCRGLNLLLADPDLDQHQCDTDYPSAAFLAPELAPGQESDAHERYDRACSEFKKMVRRAESDEL